MRSVDTGNGTSREVKVCGDWKEVACPKPTQPTGPTGPTTGLA